MKLIAFPRNKILLLIGHSFSSEAYMHWKIVIIRNIMTESFAKPKK